MDGKSRFSARKNQSLMLLALLPALLFWEKANATTVEISGMIAYSTSDFADGYHSMQRRYTASADFKFTPVSAFEFEYTDSVTNINYTTDLGGYLPKGTKQQTSYKDIIYSFNWVQNLVSTKWILQPYLVVGGGRMNRRVSVALPEYGFRQDTSQTVTTGTGGAGVRLFLTRSMAVKGEVKTYVPNFQFSKWKENQMMSVGLSWTF